MSLEQAILNSQNENLNKKIEQKEKDIINIKDAKGEEWTLMRIDTYRYKILDLDDMDFFYKINNLKSEYNVKILQRDQDGHVKIFRVEDKETMERVTFMFDMVEIDSKRMFKDIFQDISIEL